MTRRPPVSTRTDTLFPYTTLFRSGEALPQLAQRIGDLQSIKNGKGLTPQQASTLNGLITLRGQTKARRSEEHTSELQSLMRNSYAVFCLKKKPQDAAH